MPISLWFSHLGAAKPLIKKTILTVSKTDETIFSLFNSAPNPGIFGSSKSLYHSKKLKFLNIWLKFLKHQCNCIEPLSQVKVW